MPFQHLLQSKRYLFWALQLAGWGSWAITFYLGMLVWGKSESLYIIYLPIVSTLGMLITLLLRRLYHWVWEKEIAWRGIAILAGSLVAGATWMASRVLIFQSLFPMSAKEFESPEMQFWAHFEGTTSAFMVMVVWSALYFGIKYYLIAQEEQQRRLKATAMAHEAQLKMLHYQLNPHFLFNTLNAISTLILDQNTQLANTMVTRLSRFLRYSLDNDPMLKVTVAEEVEALKLYLDIEKVRFDERLQLSFDIDDAASTALMPSLLLQPLVENSIKYAISTAINGGSIAVSASVSGDKLILSVVDDGPGLELQQNGMPRKNGVGLINCRERLSEIYGDNQFFGIETTDPHGLTVIIHIPLEIEQGKT
ncbi:MAG: histidine kinase [Pseudomonadales bacterium]|nr:histidine kinase [Halioglobus sp.]MCP5128700.1 histidine kinase [Pseudomonadales bacterium]